MGKSIKLDIELPEFDKEINISITLRKDGEVLSTSSSPAEIKSNINDAYPAKPIENSPVWRQNPSTKSCGNMMDSNF